MLDSRADFHNGAEEQHTLEWIFKSMPHLGGVARIRRTPSVRSDREELILVLLTKP